MELTINDLAAVVQIIDIVSGRGAFRGDELSQVGALRDKYAAFIKAAQEAQAAEAPAAESVDTEAPSE
jgi:hypothetical protein